MQKDGNDILERLKHPEQETSRRRPDRLLFVRNILNAVFILLAVVAMAGIGFSWGSGDTFAWAYAVGIVAVLIKMVEALLRMPGLLRKPQARDRSRHIDKQDLH